MLWNSLLFKEEISSGKKSEKKRAVIIIMSSRNKINIIIDRSTLTHNQFSGNLIEIPQNICLVKVCYLFVLAQC